MLSDRAKAVAGGIFGITTTLTFGMVKQRPTVETQAALDELTRYGILKRVKKRSGGVEYTRLSDCSEYERWVKTKAGKAVAHSFEMVEPIG